MVEDCDDRALSCLETDEGVSCETLIGKSCEPEMYRCQGDDLLMCTDGHMKKVNTCDCQEDVNENGTWAFCDNAD